MFLTTLLDEIELIAGAGDADDALDLAKRLIRSNQVAWACEIRRSVSNGELDADRLIAAGENIRQKSMQDSEQARRDLRKATRDLLAVGGDNIITRSARELARYI
ncbi:hypothetical protein ABZ499_27460 [Streptomyces sp. NPDC019990]|uniref:hypothetical protein n=1 Tax=Streptomyces sp. NPDC019990 TaxID=3154693 RepID=UPI0033D43FEF